MTPADPGFSDGSRTIALVGPAYPYRGGIAQFIERLGDELSARGHSVAYLNLKRQYPSFFFPGKSQLEVDLSRPVAGQRVLDTINPVTWWRAARAVRAVGARAAVFKYWMPFFGPSFGTVARLLRRRGTKVIVVVDNALPHERRPGDRALSRYFLSATDGLIAMTESVASDIRSLVPDVPVRVVPHPVYDNLGEAGSRSEARRKLGLDAEVPLILFFGFVRRYKGLDVLLAALPIVLKELPDLQLVVAGEFYEDEELYQGLARDLGVAPSVRFDADYVPRDAVATYFSAADAVVQPYRSATQSGVAQVALHFERPVITTDVGGLAETVEAGVTGLLVPPESPEDLAAAIVRLFRSGMDKGLAERLSESRDRFGWGRMAEVIEAFL